MADACKVIVPWCGTLLKLVKNVKYTSKVSSWSPHACIVIFGLWLQQRMIKTYQDKIKYQHLIKVSSSVLYLFSFSSLLVSHSLSVFIWKVWFSGLFFCVSLLRLAQKRREVQSRAVCVEGQGEVETKTSFFPMNSVCASLCACVAR